MWEVIRARQGLECKKDEPKGFKENTTHIAKFSVKPNIKPQDELLLTPAFGDGLYTKLTRLLSSEHLILRQKSLYGLKEIFKQKKEHIISSIRAQVVPALIKRLDDTDNIVRQETLYVLKMIAELIEGRNTILEYLKNVVPSIDDPHVDASANALEFFATMGRDDRAAQFLYDCCIPKLIEKCKSNNDTKVIIAALHALKISLKVKDAYKIVISNNAVEILTELLKHSNNDEILYTTSNVISTICFNSEGIDRAVKCETIKYLIKLMDSENLLVKQYATEALMYITLSKEGKQQMLDYNGVPKLIKLICNPSDEMLTNFVLKVIGNVAENPKGREAFQMIIPYIQKLDNEYARRALKIVTWKP